MQDRKETPRASKMQGLKIQGLEEEIGMGASGARRSWAGARRSWAGGSVVQDETQS